MKTPIYFIVFFIKSNYIYLVILLSLLECRKFNVFDYETSLKISNTPINTYILI